MRNIAVIEDEDVHAAKLEENLSLYQKEYHCEFRVVRFRTAEDFLADYRSAYAVVFMDIQLPGMNGMEAAIKLRTLDKTVSLIFITSLSQYAQKGYEVDAVGYLLKPVSYYDFSLKFRKALDLYVMAEERNVSLDVPGGVCWVSCNRLMYVEIIRHRLYYHLVDGVIEATGVLSAAEKQLEAHGFLRCNNCYLVNPRFVVNVKGLTVQVGNETLAISRPRRGAFLAKLTEWFTTGAGKEGEDGTASL